MSQICLYCHSIITPQEKTVVCSQCSTVIHADCAPLNKNKCPSIGCEGEFQKELGANKEQALETIAKPGASVDRSSKALCPVCGASNPANYAICIACLSPIHKTGHIDVQLTQLRNNLVNHFNLNELKTLCFDMGVDYELLGESGKEAVARELINYVMRHDLTKEFLAVCRRSRPSVKWELNIDAGLRGKSYPEVLFQIATRHQITGDLGYALQLYKQVRQIAPTYPRIDATIYAVEKELTAGYVGTDGRVIERNLFPTTSHQPLPQSPPSASPKGNRLNWVLVVLTLLALLILLLALRLIYLAP